MRYFNFPLADWTEVFIEWMVNNFSSLFDAMGGALSWILNGIEEFFQWLPPEVVAAVLILLSWRLVGRSFSLFTVIGLLLIGAMDMWGEAMSTLALIFVAGGISVLLGIPAGILASQSDLVDRMIRPLMDFMQTMPSFVYLIPVLMIFGLGNVPAIIATVVFAMPPAVRLTNLGIRQVPAEMVEAARSFGCTRSQLLFKVQIPQAMPTLMAGVNQTVLLALSMSVIAAMIGAGGLGRVVYSGIAQVRPGIGLEGGVGIIIIAIVLDRLSQSIGKEQRLSQAE